ncbi:MAG: NAD-dependent epimerase/dehydratase [Parcubacteria group bacterium GW2011_GWA2_38_13]|nr:MAG: NAD-dependent epimerase/dehydratase [Parcubacteria group bacterium GW2011_GWA2_38_13]
MNKNIFNNTKVLIAGGTGMIGTQLVELLLDKGAQVKIVSLDDPKRAHPKTEFMRLDLRDYQNCITACKGMDYVFNLMCNKGSPAVATKKPASMFVPMILFNTNLAEAAMRENVKWYLYTSTVGVYAPAPQFIEESVWKTFPSENDKFAGWAKRMGELQLEAYAIEYGFNRFSIIRPPNTYGPFDNFDPKNSMVVPSLIKRALDGEDPFVVWGDGSAIRDFSHAKDVARAMIFAVEDKISEPLNVGSGTGISIKQLVEIIVNKLDKKPKIIWDTSKPTGDAIRLMDISRITKYGFKNEISIKQGIKDVMEWYIKNKERLDSGYNIF